MPGNDLLNETSDQTTTALSDPEPAVIYFLVIPDLFLPLAERLEQTGRRPRSTGLIFTNRSLCCETGGITAIRLMTGPKQSLAESSDSCLMV